MSQEWVITVLDDLKDFASMNGMPTLARSLEDTRRVARAEIADEPGMEPDAPLRRVAGRAD